MVTSSSIQSILDQFHNVLPAERVSVSRADCSQHARDQSSHPAHKPDLVIWPVSTAEVSGILALAQRANLPVTAWGAGTSLEGNPIPVQGGIVLDFGKMNQIVKVHDQDFQVTVQPGVLYKDMNRVLARSGLFFAPDPGANASIGGMIANNAAGIRTVGYGATRDNVLALEVVLAGGKVIRTGSRSVKQSSGYDLTHLFVGSEGTLGIVTEATLKLAPIPATFSAGVVAFASVTTASQAVFEIIGAGLRPTALELLDTTTVRVLNTEDGIELPETPVLFMEFSGAGDDSLAETMEWVEVICRDLNCLTFDMGVGREERNHLWHARHSVFEIFLRYFPGKSYLIADVSVPISNYPTLIEGAVQLMQKHHTECALLGHAGDGNMHAHLVYPPDDARAKARVMDMNGELVELAISLEGTSTGEHGVGLGKQKFMAREHGPALEVMRQLKATLDPNNILNPGKVLAL